MLRIYANFLKEHASEQENSVQSYIINHQKIWLKKASQRHSTPLNVNIPSLTMVFKIAWLKHACTCTESWW